MAKVERTLQFSTREEFLQHVPLFAGLSMAAYGQLAAVLCEQQYKKNEVIFHANDPGSTLFLLKNGVVKITIEASDRRELIVRLLYPPDFFGEMALLDALPRSATVTALEASTALLLDRDIFVELIERVPALMRKMAETLSHRLRKANDLIYSLAFLDAYSKVGRVIINLAQERGQAPLQGTILGLRLSQRQLAELTGMARGTIARVLSDFQQAGYVCMTGGQIVILEPTMLVPRPALL